MNGYKHNWFPVFDRYNNLILSGKLTGSKDFIQSYL